MPATLLIDSLGGASTVLLIGLIEHNIDYCLASRSGRITTSIVRNLLQPYVFIEIFWIATFGNRINYIHTKSFLMFFKCDYMLGMLVHNCQY